MVAFDPYQNAVHTVYILKAEKKAGKLENTPVGAPYSNVTQFWKWTPEAYLAMTPYAEMKGKWAK